MNICFICTGNTCRSPLAEGILKSKELENVIIRSAGIYATDGGPIAGNSRSLLDDNGMTADSQSQQFTQQQAEWADLILTMTVSHREMLQQTYPQDAHKIFTLKEYVGDTQLDVMDPYGGDFFVYKQTFEELSTLIDALARKLLKERK